MKIYNNNNKKSFEIEVFITKYVLLIFLQYIHFQHSKVSQWTNGVVESCLGNCHYLTTNFTNIKSSHLKFFDFDFDF